MATAKQTGLAHGHDNIANGPYMDRVSEPFSRTASERKAYEATIERLLKYETDGANPKDGRLVVRDERLTLTARWQQEKDVSAVLAENDRVLKMWGG